MSQIHVTSHDAGRGHSRGVCPEEVVQISPEFSFLPNPAETLHTQNFTMSSPLVKFISQGAIVKELLVGPEARNIVLGFNDVAEYRSNPAHFGATIGRVANRLKNAKLDELNGTVYHLAANDPPNSLHGGYKGWGLRDWTGPTIENRGNDRETVVYKYRSVHMEEGFPGTVDVSVAYTAYEEPTEEAGVKKTVLEMEYEAKLFGDEVDETAVNMTNHRCGPSLLPFWGMLADMTRPQLLQPRRQRNHHRHSRHPHNRQPPPRRLHGHPNLHGHHALPRHRCQYPLHPWLCRARRRRLFHTEHRPFLRRKRHASVTSADLRALLPPHDEVAPRCAHDRPCVPVLHRQASGCRCPPGRIPG